MTPERPAFFEGQILAAADLTSAVDYGRAASRPARPLPARLGYRRRTRADQGTGCHRKIRGGHARARSGDRRHRTRDRRADTGPAEHGGFLQRQRRLAAGRSELPGSAARNRHRRARATADHRRLRAGQPADSHAGGVRPDLRWPRRRASPRRATGTGRERRSGTCRRRAVGSPGRFRPVGRFRHRSSPTRAGPDGVTPGSRPTRSPPGAAPWRCDPSRPPRPVSPC